MKYSILYLFVPVSTRCVPGYHHHEDTHLRPLFELMKEFLWGPWAQGHTLSIVRLLSRVAAPDSISISTEHFPSLPNLTITWHYLCFQFFLVSLLLSNF